MLEGLAAWVLNTYIGEYVENLNTAQLSIALLQGAVELENLPLKKDALKYLDLPIQVKSGFIGKITLQIPIRHLRSEPWVISIEKLYLVAGPFKPTKFDAEKAKKDEQKKKVAMLEALEKDWKIQKQEKQEGYGSSWFSYGTSIASNILENIQLKIKDVHIRYEDDQLIPSCPFAFGINIKSLSAVSTNGQWEVKFVSHEESDMMHKLIDLQNFSVYLDTHATMLGNLSMSELSDALQREMFVSSRTNQFQDHEFILAPISAQTKLKRNTSALPLRSPHMPRIELNMNLDDINVCLSEDQYRCIIQWLKEIERHDRRRKCKMSCPTQPVSKCPKDWWKYAIAVNRTRIREKNEHCTWRFAVKRVKDVLTYYKAYTICLIGEQLNAKMLAEKNRIEEEFTFEELRIIRDLAYRKVKEQGMLFKIPVTPQEKPQPEVQQKGYLQSWFPGWGGWGGAAAPEPSPSGTNIAKDVGEPPPIKIEEEKELEQEIMEVIQETSENTSFLKKDVVFALMNFTLKSGSFKLICPKPVITPSMVHDHPVNVTMVELECSLINMMFESRPRTSAMKYALSLGSLYLRDKFTENSSFPCLISPQTREKTLSLSGSFSGMSSLRETRSSGSQYEPKGESARHSISADSFFRAVQEDKLFEMMYEKNPSSPDATYKLSINTKPLDLVYNPSTVRRVREFFSSRNKEMARVSKLQLTAEARRRYEVFKEQTKAELKNTLDQILAGDESLKMKKWVVDLDISAPQILIPESFVENNARMVVLDLGHLHLYNKNFKKRQDSGGEEEDEFKTPLSTPPSETEPEPEEVPSLTSLNESELYDKLYDRYTLELSDLQVMVGRAKDNWKLARNRGLSHLHVIDKFTISLQFEKRLIYTTDPQYPSTTMNATLPTLNFHINEHKVAALSNCVNIMLQPSSGNVDLSASASSQSFSDTMDQDNTVPKPNTELSTKITEKLREVDEFSKQMVAQFSINNVSLEIQSRGRPIAELQVTKVKANMTKRAFDTSVGLTVHSLLVVDALQTYGHDFELLIASHKGVRLDSKSGSILGSDPASPTSPLSPMSPRSPAEMVSPTHSTSLQTVQDAISKAFKAFVTGETPDSRSHRHVQRTSSNPTDTEAIIKLDLQIIDRNCPSNGNNCELKVATLQFSNLDIVANQETMVELLSFMKQIVPKEEDKSPSTSSQSTNISQFNLNSTLAQKANTAISKLEVTADFQRLNILLMRLEDFSGIKQARKVATFTMSSAQLQATVTNELDVNGSIGGFHILDVTPDAGKYFHTFSVGSEEVLNAHHDSINDSVMYRTAHESMFVHDSGTKALQFSLMKGVQSSSTIQDFTLDTSHISDRGSTELTNVSVQMASMCYIHSPRLLNEITQCVSEFTDFMKRVGDSIKSAASEMAKGIMTKKSDMSMFGSTTGLDFTKSNLSINSTDEMIECQEGSHILLNAQLDTPVIVIPRTSDSAEVLVAHLGHISVKNFDSLSQDLEESDSTKSSVRMFVEAKDMNLYSLNVDKHMELHPSTVTCSMFDTSIYRNSEFGLPIVHNTTVEILLEHVQPEPVIINEMEELFMTRESGTQNTHSSPSNTIDVSACIATPLNIELCKSVYEQILQTTDNLTYNENVHGKLNKATGSDVKADTDTNVKEDSGQTSKKVGFKLPDEPKKEESIISVNFKVPTLNVEMKGEFDEGYKGLVNLKLQEFVLDMKKATSYSTEIEVQLKSLIMEDMLEKEDSEHRYLMISRQCKEEKPPEPKLFLSQSCPDSCIVAPIPVMPHSLPTSFHKDFTQPEFRVSWEQQQRKSSRTRINKPKEKSSCPGTPPPSMRQSRRGSEDKTKEEDLVNIKVVLIDKFSPEYCNKYNKTNRFIDVDFNSLDANVNLQTWVVLLDFLGMGAKIHDEDCQTSDDSPVVEKDLPKVEEPSVNSVVNLKVKSFSLRLNKPEYELSRAEMSKFSAHIETRDGNLKVTGQLGSISLTDQSPHGELFRERFMTIGKQALVFDIFKYGLPDPGLQREYDIKVKLKMASVRYVHTNRFQLEFVAFLQHFLQLQDVLGRMRAATEGKKVADKASRSSRILLDIEASSPIILIPHSWKSDDVLIVDLGTLTVNNVFKHDGDAGTLSAVYRPVVPGNVEVPRTESCDSIASKNSDASAGSLMTQSIYNDLLPPSNVGDDPMTSSIYGSLEKDSRYEDGDDMDIDDLDINDPTVGFRSSLGSCVDPSFLLDSSSSGSSEFPKRNPRKTDSETSSRDLNFTGKKGSVDNFLKVNSDGSVSSEGPDYICLLDVMSVVLSDMDLYSAVRVNKYDYNKEEGSEKDLVFTDCVMKRQGGNSLKEKCKLALQIERNLENDISHAVPEFRINGELSSMHITIDINQYKLIRGILDHNLGEKLPEFQKALMSNLMDPKIHTVLSGTVWQNIGMAIDLNNVTIELVVAHYQGPDFPECSLAKLDFISSTFRFDSFSNQSKDVDLVSHEIVASDTRYRDAPVNVRPNVFDKILQPGPTKNKKFHSSEYGSFQLELHFRSTKDSNQFSILLNNMKLMCIFDWLLTVQEFLTSKPDDPFSQDSNDDAGTDKNVGDIPISPRPGSRTCSPINVSSGVMTKRGPIVEQVEVPFELKLNVSDTQFVVVEDSTTWDTNAVILKSTAVLTYRPDSQEKLLSCSLESIEVFSCSLSSEDETALSIIDPLQINIELNANPLPNPKKSSSGGFNEASDLKQRNLLLEVSFHTMNIRLSYLDMKMFLAILNSLPDQALKARNRESQAYSSKYPSNTIKGLRDLGFSDEECEKALDSCKGDQSEAAIWLTQHGKPIPVEKKDGGLSLTCIEARATCVCLCFIDDCKDSDVPLAELSFSNIHVKQTLQAVMEGVAHFSLTGDYYNRGLSGWEPFLEPWRCTTEWLKYGDRAGQKQDLHINAPEVLNVNITRTLLDLYNKTKDKWTEDYYKQGSPGISPRDPAMSASEGSVSYQRRRTPFVPFVLDNQTGCPLWYLKVTTHPSRIKHDLERRDEGRDRGYIQTSEWKKVQPGQQVSFEFSRPQKIRHKKTHDLHVNQIVVKIDGWNRLSAVSVDKVGVYFREAAPDKKSATGINAISFGSWYDPAKQHLARVVFDVRQEGSAKKVITIRSALTIFNQISSPVDVKMTAGNGLEGKWEILQVKPKETVPVPLPFIYATLYLKPSDWPTKFCDQPIKWQHVRQPGDVKEKVFQCEMPDVAGQYRFCSSVYRENYPEQILTREDVPILPGHMITVLPPVVIHNLLPIDMRYYLKGTDIFGVVKPGKKADLHAANPQQDMKLGVLLENFEKCHELLIPPDTNRDSVKLRLIDSKGRKLLLTLKISCKKGGCVNISVLSPFWLINRSGLPLVFGQTDTEAAGQFEEHELARSVTPLLFSFSDRDAQELCTMRIGKAVHGQDSLPLWCTKFPLDSGVGFRKLNVVRNEGNKPNWVYNIGIAVQQGRGKYKDTNIVNFAPRYEIDNQSSHKLAIAQRHIAMDELVGSVDTYLTALPGGKMPFHFPRLDFDQLLCVKMIDRPECMWSGGFLIDRVNSFHVNMRDKLGNSNLLKVEIVLEGPTYHIIFVDAEEFPPPFRIDNHSEVSVFYYQSGLIQPYQKATIKPKTSLPFAWDEPTLEPQMTLYVQGGSKVTYNLDKLEEGEQLCYENFIYITATATFGNESSDGLSSDLVLEVVQDNNVVFRKKALGNRAQLWRMTGSGMLEHEGSAVPRDPRKPSSSSGNSLVLDTSVIAPQPRECAPLTLKKPDKRRTSTQIWEFKEDGRLCCVSGMLCVQALGGILQEGAIAVSGPGPLKSEHRVPNHMLISRQKLRPGSGYLSVRVLMDGPIRVLEIADIQSEHYQRPALKEESGWQIYEEKTAISKELEKPKPEERKELKLQMHLKGGLGISLINRVPEELVYITLKDITVEYQSSPDKIMTDISVGDIQVDNQLLDAQRPVLLFVTRNPKKAGQDFQTKALNIVAHKVPNTQWNADIYKHLIISMKKMTLDIEEKLLWKLFQFAGYGQEDNLTDETDYDIQKSLAAVSSVKAKRYYFGTLKVNTKRVVMSMCTSKLTPDLRAIKSSVTSGILASFEDAQVDLDSFVRNHPFETSEFLTREIIQHFTGEIKSQAAKLLGSVDFLGNPLGLFNDVAEGITGLIKDGNLGGLMKNVTHGLSNTAAKVTGSLSDNVGIFNFDERHNEKREEIKNYGSTSRGGHLMAGIWGIGHGLWGGISSIPKNTIEGGKEEGIGGAMLGFVKGVGGVVPKVATGVLDLASGAANAIKDTSHSRFTPLRVRETRWCYGPGGLLPSYAKRHADHQRVLFKLYKYDVYIAMEALRTTKGDQCNALITNQQVIFLRPGAPSEDNIIFQAPYSKLKHCHTVESKDRFYVELVLNREERAVQVQCDKSYIAQKVSQQINYARNLYDEQLHTVRVYTSADSMD